MPRLETLLLSIGGSQPAAHRQPVCAPQRFVQRQTHGGCESIKASGIILPRAGALGFSASCASVPNAARHRRGGEEDALAPAPRRSVCQGSDSTPAYHSLLTRRASTRWDAVRQLPRLWLGTE
jgi:hypothetical protein